MRVVTGGRPRVVVVGVGGAGVNAVSRLMDVGVADVQLVAADTSGQTLERVNGATRIVLGDVTRGLGTGGDTRLGAAAAKGAERALRDALRRADVAFVVAGLAGGTGGGASPEVARLARRCGALTVGFGIEPFAFEAAARQRGAAEARRALADACDTFVPLDNGRALALVGGAVPLDVALRVADDVLRQAVQGLTELVGRCGLIDVDLAVVRSVLGDAGDGCLALGVGRGDEPAQAAMRATLATQLADMRALSRAGSVLVQITGGRDLAVSDVAAAVDWLSARLAPGCRLVVGVGSDPLLVDAAQVTLLGAGVDAVGAEAPLPVGRPIRGRRDATLIPPLLEPLYAAQAV